MCPWRERDSNRHYGSSHIQHGYGGGRGTGSSWRPSDEPRFARRGHHNRERGFTRVVSQGETYGQRGDLGQLRQQQQDRSSYQGSYQYRYVCPEPQRRQQQPALQPQVQAVRPDVASASTQDPILSQALTTLCNLIDYKALTQRSPDISLGTPSHSVILGDALNFIEHLSNCSLTENARDLNPLVLLYRIRNSVPEEAFTQAGMDKILFLEENYVPNALNMVRNMTSVIRTGKHMRSRLLRQLNEDKAGTVTSTVMNGEEQQPQALNGHIDREQSRMLVDKYLRKMDQWIDAWLDGKLKDGDWTTMKDCMDMEIPGVRK